MVFSTNDYETSNNEDPGSGMLLHDIEEISRALYLHNTPSKALLSPSEYQSRPAGKVAIRDVLHKNKRSAIWKWKPLKALMHIRNHQFICCFFLHVHAIEGLSSNFNDLILCVNWKRNDEVLRTHPVRVVHGIAEFEETLMHRCSIYGSRNGPQNLAKYEPKLFLLHASVVGTPALDIGKHWVDLARLLPLTLEELEEEKRTSVKWTTSFKLKGKAKGAKLNVSFGFSILGDNPFDPSDFAKVSDITEQHGLATLDHMADCGRTSGNSSLCRLGSVRRISTDGCHHSSSRSLDIKFLDDIFCNRKSELAQSITFLSQKLDDGKFGTSEEFEFFHEHLEPLNSKTASATEFTFGDNGIMLEDADFVVVDQGIETSVKDELEVHDSFQRFNSSVVETIDIAEVLQEDLTSFSENLESNTEHKLVGDNGCGSIRDSNKDNGVLGKELTIEDPQTVLHDLLTSESADLNLSPSLSNSIEQENNMIHKPSNREGKIVRPLSLDDVMESVANDFLNMLGIEQTPGDKSSDDEPESPRECLLKQFEKECWGFGDSVRGLNAVAEPMEFSGIASTGNGRVACSNDFDLLLVIQEAEKEHSRVNLSLRSRRNAKHLENLETETLMQKWGLNENAFQNSPRITSGGFGSPVYIPPEEPSELLPLGEGLGPVIQTKTGGFIRSMNSLHFKNAKNGAKLILQISNPVVLPVVMGSSVMEILQCWASEGAEKMSIQANELMPLEDITGKTMQQVTQEADSCAEVIKRWDYLHKFKVGDYLFGNKNSEESLFFENFENISSGSISGSTYSDYVSLEDLVPLVVTKIEALSLEGLRIQSGLSDGEAPSRTRPELVRNWASISENVKLGGVLSSLGATALQLLDLKVDDYIDELIKLSLPLDEWIKFDAGDLGYEREIDEWSLKILAAHHTKLFDLDSVQLARDSEPVKLSGSWGGLLGNNFTLALRLQLRDPFRDYETVGASMLTLAQVERVCTPMGPEMFSMKSETNSNQKEDDLNEELVNDGTNDEVTEKRINKSAVPQFKISEVHVTGLNVEPNDRQSLNTRRKLQSGSRWLLSSGMHQIGKKCSPSNSIIKSSAQMLRKRPGDVLWSISSHVHCAAAKWKELAALNIHVRNPDIILPDEPVRFQKA